MLGLLLSLSILSAPACVYGGTLDAETTIRQERADAAWAGRVRLLRASNTWPDDADDWEGEPWTLYRVQVIETFKGEAVAELPVFTWRNSGGFYMDRPGGGHDIGGEYLLFLNPGDPAALPPEARDAMVVNYSCGRSGLWRDVSEADRRLLARGR